MDQRMLFDLTSDMWRMHVDERFNLDRLHAYAHGRTGFPTLPHAASDEVKELAKLAPKNVIGMVIETFAQNLSVIGYRTHDAQVDAPAWNRWQAQRMDARQAEVHRAALTYGTAYVVVAPDGRGGQVWRPRSPRQLFAVYGDPEVDEWPLYALETWTSVEGGRRVRKGLLLDDTWAYPLHLGEVIEGMDAATLTLQVRDDAQVAPRFPHGAPVCPVVRYVNRRDTEELVTSEVAPLITLQKAINSVNFDRLIVSRFGAFPQKVISGWAPTTPSEALKASANRVWTFDDPDVKATQLQGASLDAYNALLAEMFEHVAMVAQISPAAITGKLVNLSAEALDAAEKAQQQKLAAMRDSFGESHEALLRLSSAVAGDAAGAADAASEAIWRDTRSQSFAAVVDGITKLAGVGPAVIPYLSMVPGITQAQQVAIKTALEQMPPPLQTPPSS